MTTKQENVTSIPEVVLHNACTGCATCIGVCPANALQIVERSGSYVPELDVQECTLCNLCLDVCPEVSPSGDGSAKGLFVLRHDFARLTQLTFGSPSNDPWLGHCQHYYLAHSRDEALRYSSASGGAVTILLINMLREGYIEGAVVVDMRPDDPLQPLVFIAQTEEEIIRAARSKYCPVPLGMAIREVLRFTGRVAVVGLPCHVRGFRKAAIRLPHLGKRIACYVGLVCFHNVTFQGTRFLLARLGLAPENVTRIEYRGRGWPGSIEIKMKDGSQHLVAHNEAWGSVFGFFSPLSCFTCYDGANELADISAGDAWIPALRSAYGRSPGENLLIVRSAVGEHVLTSAVENGCLELSPLRRKDVLASLRGPLARKKHCYAARLHVMRWLGLSTPEIDANAKSSVRAYFHSLFELGTTLVVGDPRWSCFFRHIPPKALKAAMLINSSLLPICPGTL